MEDEKEEAQINLPLRRVIIISVISGCVVFFMPMLFTMYGCAKHDFSDSGEIGDTIGGIAGPFIAFGAALLTFCAFWAQHESNKAQTKQFRTQAFDTKVERFERKFYELLRLHKENLNEITIIGYQGRRVESRTAFSSMYKEFRFTFFVVKNSYQKLLASKAITKRFTDEELVRLAYAFFYSGVGIHSVEMSKRIVGDTFPSELYDDVDIELTRLNSAYKEMKEKNTMPEIEVTGHPELGFAQLPKTYRPFVGHISRLGHYYRHLYQTVKFVVNQDDELKIDKIEYLRTLRAQLSDHEQVMLYYNAISGFGKKWIEKKYFTTYRMIHNLPLPLANFGISPEVKFKDENLTEMFDWPTKSQQV